jgi:S1-C subfamily serine protease
MGAARGVDGDDLSPAAQQQVISSESQMISNIAKTVGPSVVSIDVTSQRETGGSFFGYPGMSQARSAGTGIILTANGLIVTNRHVVDGATDVSVTLADGTELEDVEVVGRTRASDPLDIAFLKIKDTKGKKLAPAKLGDSAKVQVGDRVVAIGNALGQFQNTVTSGIISGYGREVQAGGERGGDVESLQDLFQTDAAINQGNSGGPLVNASGQVIGINTAVAGGDAQDIGFAIPVNNISGLIKSVIATGELKQPYLGVRYLSLTNDIAQEFGLKVTRGAYVLPADQTGQPAVVAGSPADKAGLQGGDVILQVNGTKVDQSHSLSSLLARHSIGDEVTLKVLRENKEQDIKAKLEAAPADTP